MPSTPPNERNAERFAGKINVPGSPVMLKRWRAQNAVVRVTTVEPDDDYVDGYRDPGDTFIKDREERQARRKNQ